MADYYGLDDISGLSGPNQTTARQVQQAFANSAAVRDRQAARYNLPSLANFNEDTALARAQTAAGLINANQQTQNLIDASHATPHGVAQNLSAYLPLLGAANSLIPTLFGRDTGSDLSNYGMVGMAQRAWNSIVHPATGTTYIIGPDGNLVSPGFDPASNTANLTWPNYGPNTGVGSIPADPNWNFGNFDPSYGSSLGSTVDWSGSNVPTDLADWWG